MATFLLTWNPKRKHWWGDNLEDDFEVKNGSYYGDWSCWSNQVQDGDRVFLIRLGKEPKGIVASGWATSQRKKKLHWLVEYAKEGIEATYIDVRFDVLLDAGNEEIFSRERLNKGILRNMRWDSEVSGIRIEDRIAATLEKDWVNFVGKGKNYIPVNEPSAIEGLKTETSRYSRGRSKPLRDKALSKANGICCVCEVDFKKVIGGKGVKVLQVHHKKQLGITDTPRLTTLSDLAVVCANCHMLIHMDIKKALDIKKLKSLLKE